MRCMPPVFKSAPPEKPRVQPREVAKKAVAEIKKTPPQLFVVSIAGAIAIILLIVAAIAWHIHSENADDDVTPAQPAAPAQRPSQAESSQQPRKRQRQRKPPEQVHGRTGNRGAARGLGTAEVQQQEESKAARRLLLPLFPDS